MIHLYTSTTPNGRKVSIMLEEIGEPYEMTYVRLSLKQQKEPWFLQINPNGRIPAIVDEGNDHFAVFESGAILVYLAEKYGRFMPQDVKGRSTVMQWLMFQMSGIGPMQGQAHVFYRYTDEKIHYAINRFQNETKRLYTVLNDRLAEVEFLAGDYSIADMAVYPWVNSHDWAGVAIDDLLHLQRWLASMAARGAVIRGMDIPPSDKDDAKTIANAKSMLGKTENNNE